MAAIAATVLALFAYKLFPEKRFSVTTDPRATPFLYGSKLPDGSRSDLWLDESARKFRCIYPESKPGAGYYCSINFSYENREGDGLNVASYKRVTLSLEYTGTTPKLRLFARNFDKAYSTPDDANSAKYNAAFIATKELNKEVSVNISEFIVTEWWLLRYGIERENSFSQLDNVVNIGIEFSDSMTTGNHDVRVNKIELVGEWISREHWYLFIICVWLVSFFLNTVNQLRILRKQKSQSDKVILELNESNKHLIKETDKFRKLSTVDALTQSYNRFGIDQIVSTLISSAKNVANDQPIFALILLDIDYFKRVNDRRGHDAGDRVLKQVATIITNNVRASDYIGRWGGEEFVIILPFTGHHFALALAEKIRLSLTYAEFEPDHPLKLTASAGVGSLIDGEVFTDFFKRVDDALYKSKNSGRNCCFLAAPQE